MNSGVAHMEYIRHHRLPTSAHKKKKIHQGNIRSEPFHCRFGHREIFFTILLDRDMRFQTNVEAIGGTKHVFAETAGYGVYQKMGSSKIWVDR